MAAGCFWLGPSKPCWSIKCNGQLFKSRLLHLHLPMAAGTAFLLSTVWPAARLALRTRGGCNGRQMFLSVYQSRVQTLCHLCLPITLFPHTYPRHSNKWSGDLATYRKGHPDHPTRFGGPRALVLDLFATPFPFRNWFVLIRLCSPRGPG